MTMGKNVLVATARQAGQAMLLRIEPDGEDGGVFLIRHAGAAFAGDTWHETTAEAMAQAGYEFGAGLSEWMESVTGDGR